MSLPRLAPSRRSLLLYSVICFLSSISSASAQTLYVPGGTVGNISGSNVGIGITAPNDRLQVDAGAISDSYSIGADTVYSAFSIRSSRSINDYGGLNAQYASINLATLGPSTTGESYDHRVGDLRFALKNSVGATTMTNVMTLRYNGNVGIGTASPDKLFTLLGSDTSNQIGGSLTGIHIINSNAAAAGRVTEITFGGRVESKKPFAAVSGILAADSSYEQSGDLAFSTKDVTTATYPVERMRILGNGNVGIGTTTPGTKLAVKGGASQFIGANDVWSGIILNSSATDRPVVSFRVSDNSERAKIEVNDANGASGDRLGFFAYYSGTFNEAMSIRGNGNVGIGTTNPTDKLHVAGNISQSVAGRIDNAVTDTTAAVNAKMWYWSLNGAMGANTFGLHTRDDAGVFGQVALQFVRSGTAITNVLVPNGNVGIGTTNPTYKLAVAGTIRAYEVIVNTGWSDYVFADDYRLAPLSEVEAHIKAEKHLPGIPSATEVAQGGVSLGDMQAKLLAKLEEVTLHLIAQEKAIQALQRENAELRKQMNGRQ